MWTMRWLRVLGDRHRGPLRREYDPRELDGPPPDVGASIPHLHGQPDGLIPSTRSASSFARASGCSPWARAARRARAVPKVPRRSNEL